jgi:hypothetical protein
MNDGKLRVSRDSARLSGGRLLIYLLRKPIAGNLASNTLTHKCGGLNIDACRVAHSEPCSPMSAQKLETKLQFSQAGRWSPTLELKPEGRWPANFILVCHKVSESCPKAILDQQSGVSKSTGEASRFFIQFRLEEV